MQKKKLDFPYLLSMNIFCSLVRISKDQKYQYTYLLYEFNEQTI